MDIEYRYTYTKDIGYTFGANYTLIHETYWSKNDDYETKTHYSMIDEDNVFAIEETIVDYAVDSVNRVDANADAMQGVDYSQISLLNSGATGAEELLYNIYTTVSGENGKVFEYAEGGDEATGSYWMSFLYFGTYSQKYVVEFEVEDDALAALTIKIVDYSASEIVVDKTEGGEVESYYWAENATGVTFYVYTIEQTLGDRTETNPYDMDDILDTAVTVKDSTDAEVVANATINAEVSDTLEFKLYLPEGKEDYAALKRLEVESTGANYVDYKIPYGYNEYDSEAKCYTVQYQPLKAGTYTITVTSDNYSMSFNVVATYKAVTTLTPCVYGGYWGDELTPATTATVFLGSELRVSATVNQGAERAYSVAVTSANANTATVEQDGVDYLFTATAVGDYTLTFTATNDETVTGTMTITVQTPPDLAEILNGTYLYEGREGAGWYAPYVKITAVFTPASAGALTGTLVVTKMTDNYGTWEVSGTETMTYTANDVDYTLTVAHSSGDQLGYMFGFDADFDLLIDSMALGQVEMSYVDPILGASDTAEYRVIVNTADPAERYQVVLNADGTGTYAHGQYDSANYNYNLNKKTATFTWTAVWNTTNEVYDITFVLTGDANDAEFDVSTVACTVDVSDDFLDNTMSITIGGTALTLTYYV